MDFSRLQKNWENLAQQNPLWAIVADHPKTGRHWEISEFFANGVSAVDGFFGEMAAHGVQMASANALDFGCGYGRLTQALATRFSEVTGVDFAPSMLNGAQQHNRCGERVHYVHNERADLTIFSDESFDFVLSVLVLQHMRPEYQDGYLREFVRVLRPGGVLYVQFPTVLVSGDSPPESPPEQPDEALIEMYGTAAPVARAALQSAGAEVLYEATDGWAGVEWQSMHLAARKRGV